MFFSYMLLGSRYASWASWLRYTLEFVFRPTPNSPTRGLGFRVQSISSTENQNSSKQRDATSGQGLGFRGSTPLCMSNNSLLGALWGVSGQCLALFRGPGTCLR